MRALWKYRHGLLNGIYRQHSYLSAWPVATEAPLIVPHTQHYVNTALYSLISFSIHMSQLVHLLQHSSISARSVLLPFP